VRRRVPTGFLLALAFQTLICAAASSEETAEEHFRKAAALAREGEIDHAEREYLAGLRLEPNSFAACNNLGVLYFQNSQFNLAVKAFTRAADLHPKDGEVEFNLGLAYYKTGDHARAIPHLLAANNSSHALDSHFLLGACYFAEGQWEKSIQELAAYRSQVPNNPEMLFMLQHAYSYIGDPKSALAAATELLKSYPDSAFAHQILGEAYDKEGDEEQAIQEFQRAVDVAPNLPQLHFLLGYVYWRWKHYAEAIAPLEAEVHLEPSFAESYFYLGDIALRNNETERALSFFGKALSLDPSYSEAIFGLGKAYLQAHRTSDAISALRKAEAQMQDSTELHYRLGRALIQAGRPEEGNKELERVKEIDAAENQRMQKTLNGVPVGEHLRKPHM
jgi:Flp pilus assembly protein TadD